LIMATTITNSFRLMVVRGSQSLRLRPKDDRLPE
jgi:hypothetical protein